MKTTKRESASLLVEFTPEEALLLNQMINVPLHGYVSDDYKASFEKLLPVMKKVDEMLNSAPKEPKGSNIEMDLEGFRSFSEGISLSLKMIGEEEFHTLTGFDWAEGLKLEGELRLATT
jgi:hypothetical protein